MCGIFAYVNYLQPKKREEIVQVLLQGLQRMEYRGYDSAGIAIDSSNDLNDVHSKVALLRKTGKVSVLEDFIKELPSNSLDMSMVLNVHCGIAHTRWATHGSPKDVNSHPQRSNSDNEFVVVHNGIITNFKEIKEYLTKKGHKFESETDTEVIAKLAQHVHDRYPGVNFRQLVEIVVQQLEGAFALAFKSTNFPGQLVATRRGSPLLVGIKSTGDLRSNNIPVLFSKGRRLFSSTATHLRDASFTSENQSVLNLSQSMISLTPRCPALDSADNSTTSIRALHSSSAIEEESGIEYFVASDASAIVEHTKQVIFLEDDDVVFVEDGTLSIHRISKHPTDGQANDVQKREVISLNMELQEIMKGSFSTFMQKEIFEQPDSVVNTMRGRVLPSGQVVLGGITDYLPDIKRCRRLILVACGTSYHSAIACRQILEELSELPVVVELASDFLDRQTPVFRDDVCMFVSQSGETADTLMALRYCKPHGALTIGITNTVGSSICRESHCGVHINAGPEIGVASTKAYTSQIVALLMFALTLSDDRISMQSRRNHVVQALRELPEMIRRVLQLDSQVSSIADQIYKEKSLLVMGRGFNFATCLEGALKIKELSYMHCEGIMSGELKHGPLAMVDEHLKICMVICQDEVYKKSLNALQQVVARSGVPMIIADESVPLSDLAGMKQVLRVPRTVDCLQSILTVIPLQLLAFHIAEKNGFNVDRPRNLAKSVTVDALLKMMNLPRPGPISDDSGLFISTRQRIIDAVMAKSEHWNQFDDIPSELRRVPSLNPSDLFKNIQDKDKRDPLVYFDTQIYTRLFCVVRDKITLLQLAKAANQDEELLLRFQSLMHEGMEQNAEGERVMLTEVFSKWCRQASKCGEECSVLPISMMSNVPCLFVTAQETPNSHRLDFTTRRRNSPYTVSFMISRMPVNMEVDHCNLILLVDIPGLTKGEADSRREKSDHSLVSRILDALYNGVHFSTMITEYLWPGIDFYRDNQDLEAKRKAEKTFKEKATMTKFERRRNELSQTSQMSQSQNQRQK